MKTKISSRILALLIDNVGIYALIVGIFINIGKDSTFALSIGSLIYTIPFIGIILVLVSNYIMSKREDGKALHDIIARTKVINV